MVNASSLAIPRDGKQNSELARPHIKAEARYDGLWVLRTNTVYNAETVAHV